MFKGKDLIKATKHCKEKVIAPILEKELGVKCFVDLELDTNNLGTFTGEVERNKCFMVMKLTNCDLAIASEGFFGQHPTIFFITADDEILIFIDKINVLEIIVRELTAEINFNGSEIETEEKLLEFATNTNFPSHGLILRKSRYECADNVKGITNVEEALKINNENVCGITDDGLYFYPSPKSYTLL